ncbi:MAG: sensor histidine kinase [Acidimicrobiia bacterium]
MRAKKVTAKDALPVSVWRLVGRFALIGLTAFAGVAVVTSMVSREMGRKEAIRDARRVAFQAGRGVVGATLDDGILTMQPESLQAVDRVVREFVLQGSLTRVKIWRADGTIVYSDETRLIGDQYELGEEELETLSSDQVEAEISDLSKPENRFEAPQQKLLETYLPVELPGGATVLFEAYFQYAGVTEAGRRVWLNFAPISLGALAALEIIQIPIALGMARRLKRSQEQREQLMSHAIEASETERRRIARDLHDGVVQELTGVSFTLAAAARRSDVNAQDRALLDDSSARLREGVRSLRSLLVEIYPPNLQEEGLPAAIGDLLARLSSRGIKSAIFNDLPDDLVLTPNAAGLLYRSTQEALRNIVSHAEARNVQVHLRQNGDRVSVTVEDDGKGFDPRSAGAVTSDGHVGLRALADLIGEGGGSVSVESAPGSGTALHIEVPLT